MACWNARGPPFGTARESLPRQRRRARAVEVDVVDTNEPKVPGHASPDMHLAVWRLQNGGIWVSGLRWRTGGRAVASRPQHRTRRQTTWLAAAPGRLTPWSVTTAGLQAMNYAFLPATSPQARTWGGGEEGNGLCIPETSLPGKHPLYNCDNVQFCFTTTYPRNNETFMTDWTEIGNWLTENGVGSTALQLQYS